MNIRRPGDTLHKKKRMREGNKRRILIGSGIAGVVVLLAVGGWFAISRSGWFRLDGIDLTGVPDAHRAMVERDLREFSARSRIFRWFGEGNIVSWSADTQGFVQAYPQFKTVSIEKRYFGHRIRVDVSEREQFGILCNQPVGAGAVQSTSSADTAVTSALSTTSPETPAEPVRTDNESASSAACYWFDRDGFLFAEAPPIASELFYRLNDSTGRVLGLRDRVLPDRLFVNLVRVFDLLERAHINTKTVSLSDLALEEVEVKSLTDPRILFSLRFDPAFSVSAIDELRRTGEWNKLSYVDLTVENRAAYR